jgi:ArsR family transcriptional regulator
MQNSDAITAMSALAQESRLAVFRVLVRRGPAGLTASKIAAQLGIPASSLSFHLKELTHAGLIQPRQEGRFIHYAANFDAMKSLIDFLADDCCGGVPCFPESAA